MEKIGIIYFNSSCLVNELDTYENTFRVNLKVFFDTDEFVGKTMEELFLESDRRNMLPTTSQPSTVEIEQAYTKALQKYEKLIVITPAPSLSGTYSNAILAAEVNKENISVISSGSVAPNEYICVTKAIEAINDGMNFEDLVSFVTKLSNRINTYVTPGKLSFLKKGGRVNMSQLIIGSIIKLHLIIEHTGEKPEIFAKCRGEKSLLKEFLKLIDDNNTSELYFTSMLNDPKYTIAIEKYCLEKNIKFIYLGEASLSTGCHFGPQSFGFSVI